MTQYIVAFSHWSPTTNYSSHQAQVYFNGNLLGTATGNTTGVTITYFICLGYLGNNNLRFSEIGALDAAPNRGLYIDSICIEEAFAGACGTNYLISPSNSTTTANTTILNTQLFN